MKRLCFSSPHTWFIFFYALSMVCIIRSNACTLLSQKSVWWCCLSLLSFSFLFAVAKENVNAGVFSQCVAKEGLASSLFAGKKRREIFRFEFIIDRVLPKTTTQLNSPLSSATILIPQNFFFLFVRAKAPPPQKQNKTNHFYEHVWYGNGDEEAIIDIVIGYDHCCDWNWT